MNSETPAVDPPPLPAPAAPTAPTDDPTPIAGLVPRLPKGVHANWELGAQLIAAGQSVEQVGFNLRVGRDKVMRNLRESRRFRQMIEKERLARREASALRLRAMQTEVVDQLAEAIRDGDRRILLWAAKQLNVTAGWPDLAIAAQAAKDLERGREVNDLIDDDPPAA